MDFKLTELVNFVERRAKTALIIGGGCIVSAVALKALGVPTSAVVAASVVPVSAAAVSALVALAGVAVMIGIGVAVTKSLGRNLGIPH